MRDWKVATRECRDKGGREGGLPAWRVLKLSEESLKPMRV